MVNPTTSTVIPNFSLQGPSVKPKICLCFFTSGIFYLGTAGVIVPTRESHLSMLGSWLVNEPPGSCTHTIHSSTSSWCLYTATINLTLFIFKWNMEIFCIMGGVSHYKSLESCVSFLAFADRISSKLIRFHSCSVILSWAPNIAFSLPFLVHCTVANNSMFPVVYND